MAVDDHTWQQTLRKFQTHKKRIEDLEAKVAELTQTVERLTVEVAKGGRRASR